MTIEKLIERLQIRGVAFVGMFRSKNPTPILIALITNTQSAANDSEVLQQK